MYANIITQEQSDNLPGTLTFNGAYYPTPSPEDYQAAGWRTVVHKDAVPDGMLSAGWSITDNGDGTCNVTLTGTTPIPPPHLTPDPPWTVDADVIPYLQAFRVLVRTYFGATAETDTTVTQAVVSAYFLGLQNPTGKQAMDASSLAFLYGKLSPLYGGNLNNVPWSQVP